MDLSETFVTESAHQVVHVSNFNTESTIVKHASSFCVLSSDFRAPDESINGLNFNSLVNQEENKDNEDNEFSDFNPNKIVFKP